jgi:hypothetical protein
MATFYLNHESELYHYGVKGMTWGKHKAKKDYIYTSKKYDNGRIWTKDKEKLNAVRMRKMKEKIASMPAAKRTAQGRAEYDAYKKALAEQHKQREFRKKELASRAENASVSARDIRNRNVDAQNRVLKEQERLRASREEARKRANKNVIDSRDREFMARNKVLNEQGKERRRRKSITKANERSSVSRNAQYYRGKR